MVIESCQRINATAKIFKVRSEESVDKPHLIRGKRVLVVEDGPSITHGELGEGVGAFRGAQAKLYANRPKTLCCRLYQKSI